MIKSMWSGLSPSKKKVVAIIGAVGVVLLAVFAMSSIGGNDQRKQGGKQTIGRVLYDGDPRSVGIDSINSKQRDQEKTLTEVQRNLKTLLEQSNNQKVITDSLKTVQQSVDDLKGQVTLAKEQADKVAAENLKLAEEVRTNQAKAPPPEREVELKEKEERIKREKASQDRFNAVGNDPNKNQSAFFANAPAPAQDPVKPGQAPKKEDKIAIRSIGSEQPKETDGKDEKEQEVFLPAGSIMSGALITGLDAPTGTKARQDPFPVLLRIKKEAVLPNRFRADVRECFLIASAFGDMSSERAYMRAETISCVRDDGGVIETGMDAYASGEDGKAGVRGRLISKQGAILARSLAAGFMQGVSEAFSVRQVPSINVTGTGSSSGNKGVVDPVYEQAFNSQALQGAAIGGTGKALERIADFYLEMAENLYPVIEVDAAREVDFIVKKGVQLKLMSKAPRR
ncbi:pilus assembly protein [Pseudomonas sp. ITA]|uniref:TraB/VirB10 family protein n=1 Tax=Pseudomonas sp. ITA TaxID=2825841 RepID=UPI00249869EC|nr:TraB/VirB10 family protein [Pseudomonas sp. ITA]MDI2144966.1 pilus assembly protein [Pseudomonas sp. ITA]